MIRPLREMTFTKNFDDRVFDDGRPEKFWCLITTVVKGGKLEAIEFLWNFTPVTMKRNLQEESPYLNWVADCCMDLNSIYGTNAVAKAVVRAVALSFTNLNEEVSRLILDQQISSVPFPT
jgi:hypothetical protein